MFPKWESIQFPHIILDKNSKEYKNIEKIMMPNRELPFNKLKKIGNIIGFDGLDLLQKCLDLHPDKRISAKLALNHSFFDEIRNNFGIEEEYKEKINFDLQNLENTSLIGIFKMMKKNEVINYKIFFNFFYK